MTDAANAQDLPNRIADAQAEIAAALLFYTPRHETREVSLAYQRDQLLKSLLHISEGLAKGFPPYPVCEACGLPIKGGEPYVNDSEDALDFHPECAGVDPAGCAKVETREEQAADLVKRIAETRAYLDAGGYLAGVGEAKGPLVEWTGCTHLDCLPACSMKEPYRCERYEQWQAAHDDAQAEKPDA